MVGQVGCSIDDFWYNQNPRESSLIFYHYIEEKKALDRAEWEKSRWLANKIINFFAKEGTELPAHRMFPMPWDNDYNDDENLPSEQQFRFWKKRFDKKPAKVKRYG